MLVVTIMRISTFLFQLVFFSQVIFGDDFYSKFHQLGYKMKDVRLQVISFNKNYLNFFEIKAFKYNRTTTAHNLTLSYKVDVQDKIELLVQAYKFLSNEYRRFPMRYQINAAKTFQANLGGCANMIKCGNLRNGFVFSKDVTYSVCNFVIDENQFPPLIPSGRYQTKIDFIYLENVTATMCMYSEVYTPMKY